MQKVTVDASRQVQVFKVCFRKTYLEEKMTACFNEVFTSSLVKETLYYFFEKYQHKNGKSITIDINNKVTAAGCFPTHKSSKSYYISLLFAPGYIKVQTIKNFHSKKKQSFYTANCSWRYHKGASLRNFSFNLDLRLLPYSKNCGETQKYIGIIRFDV